MTDEQKFKVKQIIGLKNRMEEMQHFVDRTGKSQTIGAVFTKRYVMKFLGVHFDRNIELSEDMFLYFWEWLREYIKHLEGVINSYDAELISIADAIRNEEITKEGLTL